MSSIPFIREDAQGELHFGKQGACKHCGTPYRAWQYAMPQTGREYTAHIPSDTCCPARAREVVDANKMWAARYSNLAQQTAGYARAAFQQEAGELATSTRAVTAEMKARYPRPTGGEG